MYTLSNPEYNVEMCRQVQDLGIETVHCSTDLASFSYNLTHLIEVLVPDDEGERQQLYGDAYDELDLCARLDGLTKTGTWR